jgi:hypothetical protein
MGIIDDLLPITNDILGVRDDIGAVIHPIYLVTRTWSGESVGDGTYLDVEEQMLPSPSVQKLTFNLPALQAGQYEVGDLIIRHISKQNYPDEDVVSCKSSDSNIEKFYKINGKFYQVISVNESYVTWEVTIRKVSG